MIEKLKELVREGTEEYSLALEIDKKRVPKHIAVIMDGNGRWAKQQGLKRDEGHKEGAVSARKITEHALGCGVKFLTLFAFSSENWKRPPTEVNTLMNMLYKNLVEQKSLLIDNDIKFDIVGDIAKLPGKLKKKLMETIEISRNNKAMQLTLALNYGGRMEIVHAVKRIVEDNVAPGKINEKLFNKYLYTADYPDPDLLIRTSGEQRISNFLLYQAAYSELYFTPVRWPSFRLKEFLEAILEFQRRERRFGQI
ncbi:MAG: isoprenyl transferase [bacterium]|nr:isoprenyl transferase [bacterium]